MGWNLKLMGLFDNRETWGTVNNTNWGSVMGLRIKKGHTRVLSFFGQCLN